MAEKLTGFPGLPAGRDLFEKLERELTSLREGPGDRDVAFNFFVTAESLTEYHDADKRFKHSNHHGWVGCLLVACHLAILAKHQTKDHGPCPVTDSWHSLAAFQADAFQADAFQTESSLPVVHDAAGCDEHELPARTTNALDVATEVVAFWRQRFPESTSD